MISKLVAKLPGKPLPAKGTPEKMMLSKAAVAKAAAKVESAKAKAGNRKEETPRRTARAAPTRRCRCSTSRMPPSRR